MAVGFTSLGTFSRRSPEIVGEPPSRYRAARAAAGRRLLHDGLDPAEQPHTASSDFGEAPVTGR